MNSYNSKRSHLNEYQRRALATRKRRREAEEKWMENWLARREQVARELEAIVVGNKEKAE